LDSVFIPLPIGIKKPDTIMHIKDTKDKLHVTNANLSGSEFADVNLQSARFLDVNLSGAQFSDVNLSGAKFSDINLSDVKIENCDYTGMRIQGILVSDLLKAYGVKP
jgi:uncharacterized protein YjbI with pentapeptide repeats